MVVVCRVIPNEEEKSPYIKSGVLSRMVTTVPPKNPFRNHPRPTQELEYPLPEEHKRGFWSIRPPYKLPNQLILPASRPPSKSGREPISYLDQLGYPSKPSTATSRQSAGPERPQTLATRSQPASAATSPMKSPTLPIQAPAASWRKCYPMDSFKFFLQTKISRYANSQVWSPDRTESQIPHLRLLDWAYHFLSHCSHTAPRFLNKASRPTGRRLRSFPSSMTNQYQQISIWGHVSLH